MRTRTGVCLIALLLVTGCGMQTGASTGPADVGEASLPWLADGALHVGDQTVATAADRVVGPRPRPAGTRARRAGGVRRPRAVRRRRHGRLGGAPGRDGLRRADPHSRWWVLDRDRLVPVLDEPAVYVVPVLSADGGTAAWVARQVVTAYDVPTRTDLGRTPCPRRSRWRWWRTTAGWGSSRARR
ncbi:MAG: hypothetical protein ABIO16_02735, partial [Nocardioides sp.]